MPAWEENKKEEHTCTYSVIGFCLVASLPRWRCFPTALVVFLARSVLKKGTVIIVEYPNPEQVIGMFVIANTLIRATIFFPGHP